ncbi:hypothetical protein PR048_004599 [Dryococelus australis]|uniref:Uncharacterized protein n=1 Tax=Dryococelus australis TaxID=614101 RepID=A0ABQ9I5X2_9NEOP|nr:hypothetical protein PR048_004599 [Dryococelus australis]
MPQTRRECQFKVTTYAVNIILEPSNIVKDCLFRLPYFKTYSSNTCHPTIGACIELCYRIFINKITVSQVKAPQVHTALQEHCTPVQSPARSGDGALVACANVTLIAHTLLSQKKERMQRFERLFNNEVTRGQKRRKTTQAGFSWSWQVPTIRRVASAHNLSDAMAHPGAIARSTSARLTKMRKCRCSGNETIRFPEIMKGVFHATEWRWRNDRRRDLHLEIPRAIPGLVQLMMAGVLVVIWLEIGMGCLPSTPSLEMPEWGKNTRIPGSTAPCVRHAASYLGEVCGFDGEGVCGSDDLPRYGRRDGHVTQEEQRRRRVVSRHHRARSLQSLHTHTHTHTHAGAPSTAHRSAETWTASQKRNPRWPTGVTTDDVLSRAGAVPVEPAVRWRLERAACQRLLFTDSHPAALSSGQVSSLLLPQHVSSRRTAGFMDKGELVINKLSHVLQYVSVNVPIPIVHEADLPGRCPLVRRRCAVWVVMGSNPSSNGAERSVSGKWVCHSRSGSKGPPCVSPNNTSPYIDAKLLFIGTNSSDILLAGAQRWWL